MIFPKSCKFVGYAGSRFLGDTTYFLSQYLICEKNGGFQVCAVSLAEGTGMMRDLVSCEVIAETHEVTMHPERVNLHNRGDLIQRALQSSTRCTIFTGIDEHMTFICDPDSTNLTIIHVYDVTPPRPHLAETIKELEKTGIFGELELSWEFHINDLTTIAADVYPCRASGFDRTIDSDLLQGDEAVAGCMTARQILSECYGKEFSFIDICPANAVRKEPFIARCCRSERTGFWVFEGKRGIVVHWGDSPKTIADAVFALANSWREHG
ncbi:MAG: hypothetical protein JXA44_05180 [Methanospirillaceae archaeon]|nr:hypothetical protein [Methanospirillaceae archaeon]